MNPYLFFTFLTIGFTACHSAPTPLPEQHPAVQLVQYIAQADHAQLRALNVEGWLAGAQQQQLPSNYGQASALQQLKQLQQHLQSSFYQLYSFEAALAHFGEQLPYTAISSGHAQEVVVVAITDKTFFYIKMKQQNYHSILPLAKGKQIIGWL